MTYRRKLICFHISRERELVQTGESVRSFDMNSPEEMLKVQRSVSVLSGTKWICLWLIAVSALIGAASLFFAIRSGESVLGALGFSLPMITILLLVRHDCESRLQRLRDSIR